MQAPVVVGPSWVCGVFEEATKKNNRKAKNSAHPMVKFLPAMAEEQQKPWQNFSMPFAAVLRAISVFGRRRLLFRFP